MLLSILFIIVSIAGGTVFYDPYHNYNVLESAAYAGLSRPVFAAGIVGIIYVSSYGYPCFIRDILTWPPWIPLSKLVYGAYLMHMQFQLRSAGALMSPRYFSYFDVVSIMI